jgi:hypothetical protein
MRILAGMIAFALLSLWTLSAGVLVIFFHNRSPWIIVSGAVAGIATLATLIVMWNTFKHLAAM